MSSAAAGVQKQVVHHDACFRSDILKAPFHMDVQQTYSCVGNHRIWERSCGRCCGRLGRILIYPRDIRGRPHGAQAQDDQFTANLTLVSHDGQGVGGGPVDALCNFQRQKGAFEVRYRIFNSGNWSLGVFSSKETIHKNEEAEFRHFVGPSGASV